MNTDTRKTIIDSAIVVFNDDLSAALEKVAEHALITRRTLHRYFRDRKELMDSCETELLNACHAANLVAYHSSDDPVKRLENMFYAGMNCGIKSSFLHKLHHLPDHTHHHQNKNCSDYDNTFSLWTRHLLTLQKAGLMSPHITLEWAQMLFRGIVSASAQTQPAGFPVDENTKKLAWFSFSKGIGL